MSSYLLGIVALVWSLSLTPTVATSYSCQQVYPNPMICGLTRSGEVPHEKGMACPVAWLGRVYHVKGIGVRQCNDTGQHDYLNDLPHLDIYNSSYEASVTFGIQEREAVRLR